MLVDNLLNKFLPKKKHHQTVWREEANTIEELLAIRETHQTEQQASHNRKKLERLLASDAKRKKNQLINTLTRMGLSKSVSTTDFNGKPLKKTNTVKTEGPILINDEFYMLKIKTSDLPGANAKINALDNDEILETLGYSLGCEVTVYKSKTRGFWYVISRKANMGAIPSKINYDEVLSLLPKRASRFSIPWGVTTGKKLIWSDLRQLPHGIIAGSTKSGKSVMFKNIILTLCHNSPPDKLRVLIVDFKNAGDFAKFKSLDHIGTPDNMPVYVSKEELVDIDLSGEFITETERDHCRRIVTEPTELEPILTWANKQINKRNAKFSKLADEKALDITNIIEYNNHFRRKPMPYYTIFIDELPIAMIEHPEKTRKKLNKMLSAIVRKGRSAGFLVYVGAQSADSGSIGKGLLQNMGVKMAGRSTSQQSVLVLGKGTASKIKLVPGRVAIKTDDQLEPVEIQTPWISPKLASKMVDDINRKWSTTPDQDPIATELFKLSLLKHNKIFDPDRLFKEFPNNDDFSRAVCRNVARDYEINPNTYPLTAEDKNKGIEIDGRLWFLLPAVPGKRPRKLISEIDLQKLLDRTTPIKPIVNTDNSIVQGQESIVQPEPSIVQPLPEDVFKWCLLHNDGYFSIRKTYDQFGGDVGRPYFEKMGQDFDGKTIEIDGEPFKIGDYEHPKGRPLLSIVQRTARQTPNAQEQTEPIPPDTFDLNFDYILDNIEEEKEEEKKEKSKHLFPLAVAVNAKDKKKFESLKKKLNINEDAEAFSKIIRGIE